MKAMWCDEKRVICRLRYYCDWR